ncbi:MAG: hypothetical protein B7X90_01960 [Novosphingobium sp. 17-62-19]|uniref:PilZ domain-containing protein n=1 Tax=Novosphingobium sp. 17-62-19 TaxID=1970406 RepID=UPI000BCF17CA|nr:PilZ domain-containing protein [Novosphingobium sp. 17-62-19]OYX93245.1 MAG: hypothetical protein B7Y74_10155 [Novosphingobium sp. 35-62-5]OZA21403.1 MAG: hypothetical protein B7X90_01960 [Novosphingobium sp. 17-62-19]HQS95049.1 PilZ domain-containing protein [Novosphingobium sp.]
MWLDHSEAQVAKPWNPQAQRAPVVAKYRRGILRAKVNVRKLSRFAASIECLECPRAGSLVWITLPGLEARSATVEASEGFVTHVRFSEPFHPAVLDAFLGGSIASVH